jgi:hypothetical protein
MKLLHVLLLHCFKVFITLLLHSCCVTFSPHLIKKAAKLPLNSFELHLCSTAFFSSSPMFLLILQSQYLLHLLFVMMIFTSLTIMLPITGTLYHHFQPLLSVVDQ